MNNESQFLFEVAIKCITLVRPLRLTGCKISCLYICLSNPFAQVHIRVASPPIKYPCYMGINIPTREELIANKMSIEEIKDHIGMYGFLHFYHSIQFALNAV